MRHSTLYKSQLLFIIGCFFAISSFATQANLPLTGIHYAVSCFEPTTENVVPPVPLIPVKVIKSQYNDQVFKLGCQHTGFQGYFAPQRWTQTKNQGDGGVDVTGAPNSLLVEGANRASFIAWPESKALLQMTVPTEGFISFEWMHIGGSNLLNQRFNLQLNGQKQLELSEKEKAGSFFSDYLHAGDVLSLEFEAGQTGFEIQFTDFEFVSNATSVIERRWELTGEDGSYGEFQQYIAVKKPDINLVLFPPNFDGMSYPMLGRHDDISPAWTSYPTLDMDGDWATTTDQYNLTEGVCGFDVKWEDEGLYDAGICIVYRKWIVFDRCGDNTVEKTQIIKMEGACPEYMPNAVPPIFEESRELFEQSWDQGQRTFSSIDTLQKTIPTGND
ncbi:MAG TPA: hypothetical protein PKA00_20015 [Saprospiraceae bacterium]|nr:hypothetical protein [Saprospiraceae bacterium]HMQ85207.1 hypothetical protein [Saprospiraceae bacterium]